VLLVCVASPARAKMAGVTVDSARELGERGRAKDAILTCTSRKMRESFRHEGLPAVRMIISGRFGDIALAAAEAKRAGQPFQIADSLITWQLNVAIQPATFAAIHSILVQSASGAVAPADLVLKMSSPDGQQVAMGTFTSEAAKAIVEEAGQFQIVAVLEAGERSCDVSPAARDKLGL
jgi:hypothetical protein